jgi:hypothetical protein
MERIDMKVCSLLQWSGWLRVTCSTHSQSPVPISQFVSLDRWHFQHTACGEDFGHSRNLTASQGGARASKERLKDLCFHFVVQKNTKDNVLDDLTKSNIIYKKKLKCLNEDFQTKNIFISQLCNIFIR